MTDRLRQLGRIVQAINNGANPDDGERFADKGSELWWRAREAFENDIVGFDMSDPEAVEELIADLNRPKYTTDSQARIKVNKFGLAPGKSENSLSDEERASRSPDRGDSFVLALLAKPEKLNYVEKKPRSLIPNRI